MADRGAICSEIRRRHGIANTAPVIVTLGGNQLGKGIQFLLAAWPRVLEAVPEARWLLCGPRDPWYVREIEPKLAGYRSIVATGPLMGRAVFEHLAAADLHVNPSMCESLNMVTVEAASVGTPTITRDGAGISHWVRRHDAGLVVPNRRVPELADAIIMALQSPDLLNKWAISCESLASQFKVEKVARMLIDCVANLNGKSSPK
jgi:glycosyltransferase involved in cell wall biosynthesis